MIDGVGIQIFFRNDDLHDVFHQLRSHQLQIHVIFMLGGDDDRVNADGSKKSFDVIVFTRHLQRITTLLEM